MNKPDERELVPHDSVVPPLPNTLEYEGRPMGTFDHYRRVLVPKSGEAWPMVIEAAFAWFAQVQIPFGIQFYDPQTSTQFLPIDQQTYKHRDALSEAIPELVHAGTYVAQFLANLVGPPLQSDLPVTPSIRPPNVPSSELPLVRHQMTDLYLQYRHYADWEIVCIKPQWMAEHIRTIHIDYELNGPDTEFPFFDLQYLYLTKDSPENHFVIHELANEVLLEYTSRLDEGITPSYAQYLLAILRYMLQLFPEMREKMTGFLERESDRWSELGYGNRRPEEYLPLHWDKDQILPFTALAMVRKDLEGK